MYSERVRQNFFFEDCEINDVEDEIDFALVTDDSSPIELDHLESDIDVIVVRKKEELQLLNQI